MKKVLTFIWRAWAFCGMLFVGAVVVNDEWRYSHHSTIDLVMLAFLVGVTFLLRALDMLEDWMEEE